MRSGAAAGHVGYFHETALYGSDEELVGIVRPFLMEGVEAGEPTLVAFGQANAALIRSALPDTSGVTFVAGADQYARPATTIRSYREMLATYVAAGATQIRIVGDVPHPGMGLPWHWWARYEAAVNRAYEEFPVWGLCPYDTRITPDYVLAEVGRTHPHVATADGRHLANSSFEAPVDVLRSLRPADPDPLERHRPVVDLVDPTPAAARRATREASAASGVPAAEVDDLVVAVSEAVTNALRHGHPPVVLRAWAAHDRMVVTVSDRGAGPADPFAGLVPAAGAPAGGLGLWLAHQLCSHVTFDHGDDGFTIRLVVGTASVAA